MKTILAVDNDPDDLDDVTRLLGTEKEGAHPKYDVLDAESPRKALQRIAQARNAPALAIVDLRLERNNDPNDLSGLELITNPDFPSDIPVIILSNNDKIEPLQRLLNSSSKGRIKYVKKSEAANSLIPMIDSSLAAAAKRSRWKWAAWALIGLSALPLVYMAFKLWDREFLQGVVSNLLVNALWLSGVLLLKWTQGRF